MFEDKDTKLGYRFSKLCRKKAEYTTTYLLYENFINP